MNNKILTNYEKVFNKIVNKTEKYVKENNIQCMILGISGGIDSTVVATICREVSNNTGIPLIGRSLTILNKKEEFSLAKKVGNSLCDDFKEIYLWNSYIMLSEDFENSEGHGTAISEGNIMARLRMIYLYNIAGIKKGIVMDTDNLTEHYLGFWTIHGDEGDFNPIGGLWKTEVYGLAKWILNFYSEKSETIQEAIRESINAIPTDGNGISSSDLEQIGGKDYYEVDKILIPLVTNGDIRDKLILEEGFNKDIIDKIWNRYQGSAFKRRTNRVIKIERNELL